MKRVVATNLMEKEETEMKLAGGRVELMFTPYQIITLKLIL